MEPEWTQEPGTPSGVPSDGKGIKYLGHLLLLSQMHQQSCIRSRAARAWASAVIWGAGVGSSLPCSTKTLGPRNENLKKLLTHDGVSGRIKGHLFFQKAIKIFYPLLATHLCEAGFSSCISLKQHKFRSKLNCYNFENQTFLDIAGGRVGMQWVKLPMEMMASHIGVPIWAVIWSTSNPVSC